MCSGWIWRRVKENKDKNILPSLPPPPPENANVPETEIENPAKEQRKEKKKRIKTAAKKRIAKAEIPFQPLVTETRITISVIQEFMLFAIQ